MKIFVKNGVGERKLQNEDQKDQADFRITLNYYFKLLVKVDSKQEVFRFHFKRPRKAK